MPVVARANEPHFASSLMTRHITLVRNGAQELNIFIEVFLPGPSSPLHALCMYNFKYSETLSKLEMFELLAAATIMIIFLVM